MHADHSPSGVAQTRASREVLRPWQHEFVPDRSVVIPVYNGAASVAAVVHELTEALADRPTEFVLVNDGSHDDSERRCRELVEQFPGRVTFVQLSRNFGEYAAVLAGLRQCRGEAVVVVDDDGQQSGEEARRLLQTLEHGRYDAVYGRYPQQRQAWWRRCASRVHNIGFCWMLGKPRGLYLSSFKAMNRFLVSQICDNAGSCPYFDGLILQITANITQLDVAHRSRRAGQSGYTLAKLLHVWYGMCIGFSTAPFRIACVVGALLVGLGALSTVVALAIAGAASIGWTAALTGWFTLLAGAILFFLGVAGDHLARGIGQSKAPPPYVIRYVHRSGVTHGG